MARATSYHSALSGLTNLNRSHTLGVAQGFPISPFQGKWPNGEIGPRSETLMNHLRRIASFFCKSPGRVLIGLVVAYQWLVSPMLGRHCRFEPSCSRYFIEAVRKYGVVRGTCRGIWRICRCNPWHPGGYDPP